MDLTYPHTWTEDDRDPILQFSFQGNDYGFYLFSIPVWLELVCLIVANSIFAALSSFLLYYTAVRNPSTTLAYVTGFGLFLPFWIFAPQVMVNYFGIEHKIFMFCICVITPNTSIFRTTEAVFGFTPDYAKKSASSFALYFGSPM